MSEKPKDIPPLQDKRIHVGVDTGAFVVAMAEVGKSLARMREGMQARAAFGCALRGDEDAAKAALANCAYETVRDIGGAAALLSLLVDEALAVRDGSAEPFLWRYASDGRTLLHEGCDGEVALRTMTCAKCGAKSQED